MNAKTTLTAIAALLTLGVATAHAAPSAPAADTASVKVQTADLDLNTQAGAAVALRRIRAAANEVCGGQPDIGDLQPYADYRACMKATVDRTVAAIGNPTLAALNGSPAQTTAVASSN